MRRQNYSVNYNSKDKENPERSWNVNLITKGKLFVSVDAFQTSNDFQSYWDILHA